MGGIQSCIRGLIGTSIAPARGMCDLSGHAGRAHISVRREVKPLDIQLKGLYPELEGSFVK